MTNPRELSKLIEQTRIDLKDTPQEKQIQEQTFSVIKS